MPINKVTIFIFPCEDIQNVSIGYARSQWAIPMSNSETETKKRFTRSKQFFHPGSYGIFYVVKDKILTTPFISLSYPDENHIMKEVWKGEWHFPFEIRPLGKPDICMTKDEILQLNLVTKNGEDPKLSRLTGVAYFTPKYISQQDFNIIINKLI